MQLKYDHLIGLEYEYERQDCYGLVRAFYRSNFGIELPNFARPVDFHRQNIDLFGECYFKAGFRVLDVHPTFYIPGDVILMAIRSQVANHCAVLVENNRILHHLLNQRSTCEPWSGLWRSTTLNVYRHKEVSPQRVQSEMQFIDAMPLRKNAILASRQSPQ